jgi:GNAT superfamily N-acetyltransferase
MINIIRTDSANPDFIQLIKYLDADLAKRDGDDHSFYAQYNKIDKIKHTVVLYEDGKAIACGAIKEFNPTTMEVKRMYTLPESRGKGIASTILKELETWAAEMKYEKCVLETGKKQPEAVERSAGGSARRAGSRGRSARTPLVPEMTRYARR